jgi:hypothetical protein
MPQAGKERRGVWGDYNSDAREIHFTPEKLGNP